MIKGFNPCINGRHRVRRSLYASLPLMVVSDYSPMVSLSQDLAILAKYSIVHEAMDPKAIGHDLTEDVSIVVFACQEKASLSFDQLASHIVNVTMLVVQETIAEVLIVVLLEDILEYFLESSIVLSNHGLLRGKFDRQFEIKTVCEALMREPSY